MLKWIVILLAVVIAYKVQIWAGVGATVVCLLYGIYACLPMLYTIQGNRMFSNDLEGAVRWFEKAYKTGRASLNQKINYAILLMRAGKFETAETVLDEIIRMRGISAQTKATARQYRALLYQKQGRSNEALSDAEELFETYRSTTMYGLLGYLKLATGQPADQTLGFCKEAYEYNGDDRDIQDNLVLAYYKQGDYKTAKEYADVLLAEHPEFVEAVFHSALIEVALGNADGSKECLEKIDACRRTALTTVSVEEIEDLKQTLGMA